MNWNKLYSEETLPFLVDKSFQKPVLIYKHSTRCSLSSVTRARLERSWQADPLDFDCYFLDLIAFREVSDRLAHHFQVPHESPQILVINQGECVFSCSHLNIGHGVLKEVLRKLPV